MRVVQSPVPTHDGGTLSVSLPLPPLLLSLRLPIADAVVVLLLLPPGEGVCGRSQRTVEANTTNQSSMSSAGALGMIAHTGTHAKRAQRNRCPFLP